MVICIGVAVAHMTRPGGLVQPPGNECTCGNWHSAHTAGSGAAMPWNSRLARGLVLACGGGGPLSKLLSGGDTSTNSISHPIPY